MMARPTAQTRVWMVALAGMLAWQSWPVAPVQAQQYYDPDQGGYASMEPQPGYGASPYNPAPGYGQAPGYGSPPPSYGYGAPEPASPFMPGGEAPSFNGAGTPPTSMPGANGMMAWSPTTLVAGLKFNYSPQAGDYASLQSRSMGRWEQFPISIHLSYPDDMDASDKQVVKAAIAAWQKVVDITLVEQPDQAKIELTWVSELDDDEELGDTEVKGTHVDSMGRAITDKVILRMLDPANYGNVYPGVLKSAVMHQLGHALGISAHSDNNRDLMAEPVYKRQKNPVVAKAVRSLANRTLGQFIDLSLGNEEPVKKRVVRPPVDKISKRDLNTLFRMYN